MQLLPTATTLMTFRQTWRGTQVRTLISSSTFHPCAWQKRIVATTQT